MRCSKINSCSNYKFKKEVALVLNEELKALAKVNNNMSKKCRPNQAEENLRIKRLQIITQQPLC